MNDRAINQIGVPLKDMPSFLLWAPDIDYKTDSYHIIWIQDEGASLCYGLLLDNGDREVLADYDGNKTHVSDKLLGRYTIRMETTLRWLWHECLYTYSPVKMYRWYRFPKDLNEALAYHNRLYGKPQETEYLYGVGKRTTDVDTQ